MKKKLEITGTEMSAILQSLRDDDLGDLAHTLAQRWITTDTADDGPEVAILSVEP